MRPPDAIDGSAPATFVVDTRPISRVLLTRSKRFFVLLGLFLLFMVIINLPVPSGLTPKGLKCIAVFFACLGLWVTSVIPLSVTSLLAIILLPMMGIIESSRAYGKFGNEAVFFILGAFILAGVTMKCGLSSRAALVVLQKFGGAPRRLVFGVMFCSFLLSLMMPEHAVAAMMFPIVSEIARSLGLRSDQRKYAISLYVGMGWGAIIGGLGTLLGGARGPLALAIFQESTGGKISFLDYMLVALPVALMLLPVAFLLLIVFLRCPLPDVGIARDALRARIHAMGRMQTDERATAAVMVLTIFAWVGWGHHIGLANIAIGSVVVLFMLGVVQWRDVEQYVNWGIILMYGGAICLGWALEDTGAALWIGKLTLARLADTPFLFVLSCAVITLVLTEGMSNSAVVAMLLPLGLSLTRDMGLDPRIAV
ncbi:MAG: anion transporter, partial [Armatimonadetes bacterium CG_4_10_14_3_um_filter_59_10]